LIGVLVHPPSISIHAPLRGATRDTRLHDTSHIYFNPRSPAGSDDANAAEKINAIFISIHAPLRGATIIHSIPAIDRWRFQSTLPCGERHSICAIAVTIIPFQSTLPCGERPLLCNNLMKWCLFQSTLPCGERR